MRIVGFAFAGLMLLTGPVLGQASGPASGGQPLTASEVRELLEAAKATAKATRENVDYARVTPDLLYQILAKLDKLEDKLDKVENTLKQSQARSRNR